MYEQVIETFGVECQCRQTMEECAELIQAVNKMVRYKDDDVVRSDLILELVDVQIMLHQMREIFKVTPEEWEDAFNYKVSRLFERIRDIERVETIEDRADNINKEKA